MIKSGIGRWVGLSLVLLGLMGISGIVMSVAVARDNLEPGRLPHEPVLAPGIFLVANRHMRDPNFAQTVILVLSYGPNGAQGLIINRPTPIRVAQLVSDLEILKDRDDVVHIGGPVSTSSVRILLQSPIRREMTRNVFDDVYFTGSREVLEHLVADGETEKHFRVYAGYAGWAPGQLEREIERGDWHVMHPDADLIFDAEPTSIWPAMMQRRKLRWL